MTGPEEVLAPDHDTACDGLRCPCYAAGQLDLVAAIQAMRKMHYSFEQIMETISG